MLRRTNISRLAGNYAKNFHTGLNVAGNPNQSYLLAASLGALFGLNALYRLNHDRSKGAKVLESEEDVPAELYATSADVEPSPFMDRQRYYADPLEAPSAISRRNAELAARDGLSSKRVMAVNGAVSTLGPVTDPGRAPSSSGLSTTAAVPSGSGGMLGADAQARFWDRWFDKEGNAASDIPAADSGTGFLGTIKAALFANAHQAAEQAKEFEQKGTSAVVSERVAGATAAVRREEATLAKRTREAAAAAEADVKGYLGRKMDKVENSAQLESVSHQTEAKEDQGWQGIATVPERVKRSTGRPITEAERGPIKPAAAHTGLFGWVSDKAEDLKEAVVGGADEAKAAAETSARAARREAGEIGRDVRMAASTAVRQAEAAAQNAEHEARGFFGTIKDKIVGTADEAEAAARDAANNVTSAADRAKRDIANAAENADHEARGLLGSIKDKIVGAKDDAEDAAAKVVYDAKTTSKKIERDVAARADAADHEARGFFGSVKDKILGTADDADAAARDAANNVTNAADRAKRDIANAAENADHEARGLLGTIKDKIVGAKEDAQDAAAKVVYDAKTTSKKIERDINTAAQNADHEARGFFGSIKDKIVGTAHEAEGAARDAAKDAERAADQAKRDVKATARDVHDDARGFFGSMKDKIVGAAHDVELAAERGQKNE